jgi:hypothetical protein
MRVLISILMATSTLIAFGLYTLRREGPGNALFALFVAVGFFELEVGSFMDDSFFAYPSSGPFRFFWIYPILFILAQIYLCESREPRRRWVRLGYGTWMLGCLWSAESAIYVCHAHGSPPSPYRNSFAREVAVARYEAQSSPYFERSAPP